MFIKRIISLCIFVAFTSPLYAVDLGDFTKDIEKQVTDKIKDGLSGTETDQNIPNDNPVQKKSTQNSLFHPPSQHPSFPTCLELNKTPFNETSLSIPSL